MGAVTLSSLFSMRFTRRSGRRKPAFGIVTGVAKRRIDSTMIFILGQGTDGYDTSRVDGVPGTGELRRIHVTPAGQLARNPFAGKMLMGAATAVGIHTEGGPDSMGWNVLEESQYQ